MMNIFFDVFVAFCTGLGIGFWVGGISNPQAPSSLSQVFIAGIVVIAGIAIIRKRYPFIQQKKLKV